jgi:hypothetical protein
MGALVGVTSAADAGSLKDILKFPVGIGGESETSNQSQGIGVWISGSAGMASAGDLRPLTPSCRLEGGKCHTVNRS